MKTTHARHATLALAAATLVSTACSTATSYRSEGLAARRATTEVEVTNHNWMDMAVYALKGSSRIRLGSVTTSTVERFRLPRWFNLSNGSIRLEADPIGSDETYVSDPIAIYPGETVVWRIENHIALSSYHIR